MLRTYLVRAYNRDDPTGEILTERYFWTFGRAVLTADVWRAFFGDWAIISITHVPSGRRIR